MSLRDNLRKFFGTLLFPTETLPKEPLSDKFVPPGSNLKFCVINALAVYLENNWKIVLSGRSHFSPYLVVFLNALQVLALQI